MFKVPNKALITWIVTQFNVVKVIYMSKVAAGGSSTPVGADQPHVYLHSVDFWNVDTERQKFEFWHEHFQLVIVFSSVLL